MQPTVHAARLGLSRGWTEFRHYLTAPQELGWNLFFVTVFGVVLLFQRNATVEGSTLPLAMLTLPGIIGMWVAVTGYQGAAGWLAAEREDGTLLRAKAVPQGMVGYLVARIVALSLITLFTLASIFVVGCLLLPGWPAPPAPLADPDLGARPRAAGHPPVGSDHRLAGQVPELGLRPDHAADHGPHRHLGDLLPDHRPPRLGAGGGPGLPHLLARARHPLGPAARRRRRRGALGVVAAPGDRGRARGGPWPAC